MKVLKQYNKDAKKLFLINTLQIKYFSQENPRKRF